MTRWSKGTRRGIRSTTYDKIRSVRRLRWENDGAGHDAASAGQGVLISRVAFAHEDCLHLPIYFTQAKIPQRGGDGKYQVINNVHRAVVCDDGTAKARTHPLEQGPDRRASRNRDVGNGLYFVISCGVNGPPPRPPPAHHPADLVSPDALWFGQATRCRVPQTAGSKIDKGAAGSAGYRVHRSCRCVWGQSAVLTDVAHSYATYYVLRTPGTRLCRRSRPGTGRESPRMGGKTAARPGG